MAADAIGSDDLSWAVAVTDASVRVGGQRVLDGVTFRARRGALALVGNNGAGKSTLLRVLATLQTAEGRIVVDGHDLTTWAGVRAARRTLGYLPPDPDAPGNQTVADAVTYGAWLAKVPRARRTEAVRRAIARVGLESRRDDRMSSLSSGLHQRALLARATVHEPSVLFLDEPTATVDPEQRTSIRRSIRAIAEDRTIVFSTHLADDVAHAADHALLLAGGTVAWFGSAADLIGRGRDAAGADEGILEAALRTLGASPP